jgi:hypothetical protein
MKKSAPRQTLFNARRPKIQSGTFGRDEIVIDFGAMHGIWNANFAAWAFLHPTSPDTMTSGRLALAGQVPATQAWLTTFVTTWQKSACLSRVPFQDLEKPAPTNDSSASLRQRVSIAAYRGASSTADPALCRAQNVV